MEQASWGYDVIATQQIAGNNSGPFLRKPKIVVMHSTRSGQPHFSDSQELGSTLNWFVNPEGASSHWVLSELERVRVVQDSLIAWHSTYLNSRSWGIELTQPTIDRDFTDGHYANAALIGQNYVKLGVAPVWLPYWDGGGSGFVAHEDTKQGRELGKSDPGPKFDRARFIASLQPEPTEEEEMPKLIQLKGTQAIAVFNDVYKLQGLRSEFIAYFYPGLKVDQVSQADWDSIPDAHGGGGAGGLTEEEAVEANKRAAREGTG